MKKKYLDLLVKHLEKLLSIKIHPNTRKTVESLWAKNGPKKSAFKFGVGGTDENYTDYWNTASAYARANQATKESDEKDD